MIDKKLYYKSSSSLGATALGEPLSPWQPISTTALGEPWSPWKPISTTALGEPWPPWQPISTTALGEPWLPWQPVSPRLVFRFLNNIILRMRLSAPCPTPNLEGQCVSLGLDSTFCPFQHGWPYQQLNYRRHSSPGLRVTQAPTPQQAGDTCGGSLL
jgi:hypothetical protein